MSKEMTTDKYILLLGDPESDTWTVACNTARVSTATNAYTSAKEDGTPAILIFTGDFSQV